MSYLQKLLFIKQVGLSKHFNVGSGWLPLMSLGVAVLFSLKLLKSEEILSLVQGKQKDV